MSLKAAPYKLTDYMQQTRHVTSEFDNNSRLLRRSPCRKQPPAIALKYAVFAPCRLTHISRNAHNGSSPYQLLKSFSLVHTFAT